MTSLGIKRRLAPSVAGFSALALAATMAMAQGKPPGAGSGGGGGGNKPPTEAGFSLSVPAILAGSVGNFPLSCQATPPGTVVLNWSTLTMPSKSPVYYGQACAETNDGTVCVDAGEYFVQRDAAWQAPCTVVTTKVLANGAWGDNLAGDAMLKVGSPIRVELVLWDPSGLQHGQKGYNVIKLEPAELDRVSDYGHLAVNNGGTFSAIPTDLGVIVHDPAATLKIERLSDMAVVFQGAAGGEINATGKIVYGYNLRVAEAGAYRITYTLPNVSLNSCDAGVCTGSTAYLDITVGTGGGGGGGKGGGQGGGKPIKP